MYIMTDQRAYGRAEMPYAHICAYRHVLVQHYIACSTSSAHRMFRRTMLSDAVM